MAFALAVSMGSHSNHLRTPLLIGFRFCRGHTTWFIRDMTKRNRVSRKIIMQDSDTVTRKYWNSLLNPNSLLVASRFILFFPGGQSPHAWGKSWWNRLFTVQYTNSLLKMEKKSTMLTIAYCSLTPVFLQMILPTKN